MRYNTPELYRLADLSEALDLSGGLIFRLGRAPHMFYCRFDVDKRGGGKREINAPSRSLKVVQAWILRKILDLIPVHDAATAFRKGSNTLLNAQRHLDSKRAVCLDIKDFFPSITYGRVFAVFKHAGYQSFMAHVLTSLCCLNGRLPQGGVTSPALANIVAWRLDRRIAGYAEKNNLAYTRYADDLTLSGDDSRALRKGMHVVSRLVAEEGFRLNEQKSRFLNPGNRRMITGLVLSEDAIGVGRSVKHELRREIWRLRLLGTDSADHLHMASKLRGWLAYLNSVDPTAHRQLSRYLRLQEEIAGRKLV